MPNRSEIAHDDVVSEVYLEVARDAQQYEDTLEHDLPPYIDVGSVTDSLCLPLEFWETGRKPSRVTPSIAVYSRYLDQDESRTVLRILVGLDVMVAMLDEVVDSERSDKRYRSDLATNIAFSSLLAFSSVPHETADVVTDAITQYLVEASRIPTVERAVQRELSSLGPEEPAMELIRFSYGFRARDLSVFGTVPALIYDIDRETADRIVSDLQTYRAHFLLFDDVRDVERDRRDGIETPVTWLLKTYRDAESVSKRITELYRSFEYSDAGYREQLRDLERRPENLVETVSRSMESLTP